jgi:hypothetical protein
MSFVLMMFGLGDSDTLRWIRNILGFPDLVALLFLSDPPFYVFSTDIKCYFFTY